MRYIVVKSREGIELPLIAFAPITHVELEAMGIARGFSRAISAGFASFLPARGVQTHFRSEGLGLAPRPTDAALLARHYGTTLNLIPDLYPTPRTAASKS